VRTPSLEYSRVFCQIANVLAELKHLKVEVQLMKCLKKKNKDGIFQTTRRGWTWPDVWEETKLLV